MASTEVKMGSSLHSRDKQVERERYDKRAGKVIEIDADIGLDGASAVPVVLRAPYVCYKSAIRAGVSKESRVLDLCCGNGQHSLTAAMLGARVTASDIAENNLKLVQKRAVRAGVPIETVAADAEKLPFSEGSFDVVTCAGSLSYVDIDIFIHEIRRVLVPGGLFVCVDSFNHNPIYRLNRFMHYLRGLRSKSTLERMPDRKKLRMLKLAFPDMEFKYFGLASWLMPLVARIIGPSRAAGLSDRLDDWFRFAESWAFKFVAHGHTPANR